MREIDKHIVHCADTRTDQDFSIDDIRKWHLQRGWKDIGYHFYIKLNGEVLNGRPLDVIGAHCKGQNKLSIGTCFEGGRFPDGTKWNMPTTNQLEAFSKLHKRLESLVEKRLTIHGHYEFSNKTCPNFDVSILK